VEELSLQSETVYYTSKKDPRDNLRKHGATGEERKFLVQGGRPGHWHGERVEINAMTSVELVTWLEDKLKALGTTRIIPPDETLEGAYKRAYRLAVLQAAIDKADEKFDDTTITLPEGLVKTIEGRMNGDGKSWDSIIFDVATETYRGRNGNAVD
jgi:hypothetical protein